MRAGSRAMPWLAAFAVASAVALQLGFPVGSIAFDAIASTLHWERLVSGHHLEAFLPTTPKPVLTVIYGPLYAATGDWLAIGWASIAAFAAAVALIAVLVQRLAGGPAAAFTAVALAGLPLLLRDAHLGHASTWATAAAALAAWAMLIERPRYGLAGLALLTAGLLRLELVTITATALAVLALDALAARIAPARWRLRAPRRAWLLATGLLMFPIMCLHDWWLIGDPLWWTTVSPGWSAVIADRVVPPAQLFGEIAARYVAAPALVGLAAVGCVRIVRRGLAPLWIGMLGMGPGTVVLFLVMTARGQYVNERYYTSMDAVAIVAAAFGIGWLAERMRQLASMRRLPAPRAALGGALLGGAALGGAALGGAALGGTVRGGTVRGGTVRGPAMLGATTIGGVVLAGMAALAAIPGWAGLGTGVRDDIRTYRRLAENFETALPVLRAELASVPGVHDWPNDAAPTDEVLVLPIALWPQASLDLDIPLTRMSMLVRGDVDVAGGVPAAGQLVLHDRSLVARRPPVPDLELLEPTQIGDALVVPLLADSERGVWLLRLQPAP